MNETIEEIIFYALTKHGLPESTAQSLANMQFMKDQYEKLQKELAKELYRKLYDKAMEFIVAMAKI